MGKLPNMDNVTKEVKIMMDPNQAYAAPAATEIPLKRFGVSDPEDVTWKTYLDSLPVQNAADAHLFVLLILQAKNYRQEKSLMNLRARMKEKGRILLKNKILYRWKISYS